MGNSVRPHAILIRASGIGRRMAALKALRNPDLGLTFSLSDSSKTGNNSNTNDDNDDTT